MTCSCLFHRLLKAAGLRQVRFHDLRHTFASLLLQQGESPVYVKEQMGHSSIQVTVDLYGYLIPGGNKQAVDRLANAVDKAMSKAESATQAQPTQRVERGPEPESIEKSENVGGEVGVRGLRAGCLAVGQNSELVPYQPERRASLSNFSTRRLQTSSCMRSVQSSVRSAYFVYKLVLSTNRSWKLWPGDRAMPLSSKSFILFSRAARATVRNTITPFAFKWVIAAGL